MNINVQMNPCFKEVNRSKLRYIIEKGSAGSGKSVDAASNYILRLMTDPGRNLMCVRKSDITNRDSTYAELTGAIYRMFGNKADAYWRIKQSPLMLESRANGNQIIVAHPIGRGVKENKVADLLHSSTGIEGGKMSPSLGNLNAGNSLPNSFLGGIF